MTKRKRAKVTYAWAAVGRRSGIILRDMGGHYSIWTWETRAAVDCPSYGRVARVRITEVKP